MFEGNRSLFRSLRGPLMAGGVLAVCLVSPVLAAGGDDVSAKQPVGATSKPVTSKPAKVDPVDARIADLHEKLQITQAEEGQWEEVARVMRANAKSIESLIREKRKNEKDMTAMEDLRAYQEIAAAHAKAAAKLADAFDTLYQTMPDDQKKMADAVFRQHKQNVAVVRK